MRTLDDLDVAGKRVLVRADLNVPIDNGTITDDRRITASVATIQPISKRSGNELARNVALAAGTMR